MEKLHAVKRNLKNYVNNVSDGVCIRMAGRNGCCLYSHAHRETDLDNTPLRTFNPA